MEKPLEKGIEYPMVTGNNSARQSLLCSSDLSSQGRVSLPLPYIQCLSLGSSDINTDICASVWMPHNHDPKSRPSDS